MGWVFGRGFEGGVGWGGGSRGGNLGWEGGGGASSSYLHLPSL